VRKKNNSDLGGLNLNNIIMQTHNDRTNLPPPHRYHYLCIIYATTIYTAVGRYPIRIVVLLLCKNIIGMNILLL